MTANTKNFKSYFRLLSVELCSINVGSNVRNEQLIMHSRDYLVWEVQAA